MSKTSNTKPKLKALASTTQGKHFDLHFAMMTPFYPEHPKALKDAAELILDAQESAKRHNDRLLFPCGGPQELDRGLRYKTVRKKEGIF